MICVHVDTHARPKYRVNVCNKMKTKNTTLQYSIKIIQCENCKNAKPRKENFEGTKGAIRSHTSNKDRQVNIKAKRKRTYIYLQNTKQKTND